MSEILCVECKNKAQVFFRRDKIWVVTWNPGLSRLHIWMEDQTQSHELHVTEEEAEAFTDKFYAPK